MIFRGGVERGFVGLYGCHRILIQGDCFFALVFIAMEVYDNLVRSYAVGSA